MSDLLESYLRERFHFHHNCPATLSKLVASARPFPIVIVITIGAYAVLHLSILPSGESLLALKQLICPRLLPEYAGGSPSPAAVASNPDYRSQQLRVGTIKRIYSSPHFYRYRIFEIH